MPDIAVTVLVLSGGRSTRMGRDKATMSLAGTSLLDRVLAAAPAGVPVVIAGPHAAVDRPNVTLAQEDRPFGGPAAGLAAALPWVGTPVVVVCAVDMPFALASVLPLAASLADESVDAVIPVDGQGRRQLLAAAYRSDALRRALGTFDEAFGRPLRQALEGLTVLEVAGLADIALRDVDTPQDVESLRALILDRDGLA